jgi:hypothetical protein
MVEYHKGVLIMKNFRLLGIIALVAIMVSVSGCAILSSVGGTAEPHGLFVSGAKNVAEGATEIASYSVILMIVDTGYADYLTAVKAAEAEGKKITAITNWMVFLTKAAAYAQ